MKYLVKISGFILFILSINLFNSCKKDKPTPPSINTSDVTAISYTTATSGGNLTNEGSSAVLSMGICWNTTTGPTIDNSKTVQNAALGAFVSNINQLSQNTKYYVRAYATNSAGTSYGNEVTFTTIQIGVPALTTAAITSITQTSSVSGGNITSDNGAPILARGICWSTSVNPTTADNKTIDGADIGNFVSNLTGLIGNTLYYVRAYATNSVGTQYGNQVSFATSPLMPTITTTSVTSISTTTAVSGGNIISDGGGAVTVRGVCWNTSSVPTISNSKTSNGVGLGNFISNLTGLSGGTTYYIRAYATNSAGTAYGSEINFTTSSTGITVTDIDGNIYKTVTIGNQVWMAENLKTTKYNDNTVIPNVTDNTLWAALITPAYCWYHNDEATYKADFGALYNWYVLDATSNGGKNACPAGWHVPADAEWTTLTDYLTNNGYGYGGSGNQIAKSLADTSVWEIDGTAGNAGNDQVSNNSSGFTALPGGYRSPVGVFYEYLVSGYWWNSTEVPISSAYFRYITFNSSYVISGSIYKQNGLSVRCLKD
jgi:uncharacterized protein (TIGR02145 family)